MLYLEGIVYGKCLFEAVFGVKLKKEKVHLSDGK